MPFSTILWWSVLLVEEIRSYWQKTTDNSLSIFDLTTLKPFDLVLQKKNVINLVITLSDFIYIQTDYKIHIFSSGRYDQDGHLSL